MRSLMSWMVIAVEKGWWSLSVRPLSGRAKLSVALVGTRICSGIIRVSTDTSFLADNALLQKHVPVTGHSHASRALGRPGAIAVKPFLDRVEEIMLVQSALRRVVRGRGQYVCLLLGSRTQRLRSWSQKSGKSV